MSEINEAKRIGKGKLVDPQVERERDTRESGLSLLKRKIYMNALEVACKPTRIPPKNSKEYKHFQRELSILIKASQSPNIIRFYGLSENDNEQVMVLEWAQLGDLRRLYLSDKIPFDLIKE